MSSITDTTGREWTARDETETEWVFSDGFDCGGTMFIVSMSARQDDTMWDGTIVVSDMNRTEAYVVHQKYHVDAQDAVDGMAQWWSRNSHSVPAIIQADPAASMVSPDQVRMP